MPQAEIINTTSRRKMLRFGGVAALAGLLAPGIAGSVAFSPDTALLDLCRQFDAEGRELQQNDLLAIAQSGPLFTQDDLELRLERWDQKLDQITALPARTMAGIHAKSAALGLALIQKAFFDTDVGIDEQGQDYEQLAMSLVRDLAAVPV